MNRKEKEILVQNLHQTFLDSESVIVTHLAGLTVAESTELRANMRSANCKFKVTKNKIVKLALKNTKYEHLENLFSGPTAIGSSKDELAPAKILVKFSNVSDKIKIIGGGILSKPLSTDEIQNLATLPSLDEIRSKIISLINSPASKLLRTIKEPSQKMARVISMKKANNEGEK